MGDEVIERTYPLLALTHSGHRHWLVVEQQHDRNWGASVTTPNNTQGPSANTLGPNASPSGSTLAPKGPGSGLAK